MAPPSAVFSWFCQLLTWLKVGEYPIRHINQRPRAVQQNTHMHWGGKGICDKASSLIFFFFSFLFYLYVYVFTCFFRLMITIKTRGKIVFVYFLKRKCLDNISQLNPFGNLQHLLPWGGLYKPGNPRQSGGMEMLQVPYSLWLIWKNINKTWSASLQLIETHK